MNLQPRKIVFHLRPWEVGLYTALEKIFAQNLGGEIEFFYLTHHFQAEHLLRQKGKDCLNITRETQKIPFPGDWRDRLQEMENRCSGQTRNFMQYLMAERFFLKKPPSFQVQKLYKMAVFFDSFFAQHRPFFMLSNGPDHLAFWLAMDLLRCHGGHPCGLIPVSWPRDHFSMYSGVGAIYYAPQLYREYLARGLTPAELQEVEEFRTAFLNRWKSGPSHPSQDSPSPIRQRNFQARVRDRLKAMYWGVVERIRHNWHLVPYPYPWAPLTDALRRRYAALKTQKYFREALPGGVPFVYFPLHLEPDAATMLYANYYDNQLQIITALSKSLPVSWLLAVKEHPNMKSGRSLSFFRSLSRLPNVMLISFDTPSWQLVEDCRVVATLSGTTGLEAGIIGKPALVFGDPAWGYAPTALRVKSLHGLPGTILEAEGLALPRDDAQVQAFILSWAKANPQGIYEYLPWPPPVEEPANVARIGSALLRLLQDLQNGQHP